MTQKLGECHLIDFSVQPTAHPMPLVPDYTQLEEQLMMLSNGLATCGPPDALS